MKGRVKKRYEIEKRSLTFFTDLSLIYCPSCPSMRCHHSCCHHTHHTKVVSATGRHRHFPRRLGGVELRSIVTANPPQPHLGQWGTQCETEVAPCGPCSGTVGVSCGREQRPRSGARVACRVQGVETSAALFLSAREKAGCVNLHLFALHKELHSPRDRS